ncbi:HAD family hydrolase [Dasania sp. GY-MA-18]|uniref:HAD family hydrolase n=1 Tax=Dasania phycosphaerae TaxID=2950436 RepID=A0A9J6RL80_9GAMM|nr:MULTISPECIES: HAD family hydrolase [Dasania]MCR8922515.1 HAD family hydrolase [Dasania sp. GY-MA-18]MCZ0864943.1 HAD family hydrolase [Dasania phycosphaerae]MCZ0868671.1 HAD family hydrolase [Dasania phycosphaerae]
MPSIKTITFDLDDTLWQVKPTLQHAEQQTYQWLQTHTPALTEKFDLTSLMQWRMQLHNNRPELAHQISESRKIAIAEALIKVGYPHQQAQNLSAQAFAVFIKARHQLDIFDEVEPLLQQLKQRYQLGVLTNGNADVRKLPISHYFDFAYSAEQLNASKPAPDLFHAALQHSQCQPHELIHIGDHLEHDVQGALDAGCHAIWLNWGTEVLPQQHRAHEVKDLAEVPEVVARIEGGGK